ncbi:MAG: hypothetical protein Ta2E_01050 [Mycoplasmoidaceae bacterium]|nr:MAG: hypothetical protein Ta2E_01050 [Mycoplasmoidaceae bacterium]
MDHQNEQWNHKKSNSLKWYGLVDSQNHNNPLQKEKWKRSDAAIQRNN